MESFYRYFVIASISVTILFILYSLLFKKESNFKLIRVYLVSSLVFSLILPINQFGIDLTDVQANSKEELQEPKNQTPINNQAVESTNGTSDNLGEKLTQNPGITRQRMLLIYLIISSIFLARILFSIFQIILYYMISQKTKQDGFTIINIAKNSIPFSFFKLIFISKSNTNESIGQIIEHEKIHAKQFHTIDLLLTELLVAAMWFNPFIWMYKKALQQVHEFLADEGVLNSGVDQLEYQSLLVNQAAEGRLVAVSSNFSYSLIKKRIMMMSKRKTHGQSGRKILVLVPVLFVLIFGVSCMNGQEKINNKLVAAVSPTNMNVLYIGVDNPVSIAVTGANLDEVEALIDNGTITGRNGNYVVRVKKKGMATITVKADNKVVTERKFRVKTVPDPVAMINGFFNKSEFTKEELVNAKGVSVLLINFDFDMKFEVVSFNLVATYNGLAEDIKQANGAVFTQKQIELIKKIQSGNIIYIGEIKAKGPDGAIRKLSPIMVKIK